MNERDQAIKAFSCLAVGAPLSNISVGKADGFFRRICHLAELALCEQREREAPCHPSDTRTPALILVNKERNRQDAKWGEQNHPPQYWTGILMEEVGEYAEAVNETVFANFPWEREKGGYENMMKELSHVAAVAVGAMECLMRNKALYVQPTKESEVKA